MSEVSQGPGWWQAADLKWYPPELHADYVPPRLPPPPKLPPPPRGDVAARSSQAPGVHKPIHDATSAAPATPWDKVRGIWSGLFDARQGGDNRGGQGGQPPGGYGRPGALQGRGGQYAGAGGSGIDLRAIMPGGLMVLAGALLYCVFGFFPWYTQNFGCGLPDLPQGVPCSVSFNAWRRESAVFSAIVFLLAGGAFLVKARKGIPAPKVPLDLIALGAVVLGDLFFLITFFSVKAGTFGIARGWGLWVDLVVVIGINGGAVLQFISKGA